MQEDNLIFINFAQAQQPVFTETKGEGKGYVEFGEDNNYPAYLLRLYDESARHGAIVKGKVTYVMGNGWAQDNSADETSKRFIDSPNPYETLDELTRKAQTDKGLFGGVYLQVCWSRDLKRIAAIYHIEYGRIRTNKDRTQFWYCEDWQASRKVSKAMPAFNPSVPAPVQILHLRNYKPSAGAYATPDYYSALNYIAADAEVAKHVLGNAATGFSASKLITFYDGEPTKEGKAAIERKIEKRLTGSDGKKYILSFPKTTSQAPQVTDLGASDLTKEDFTHVDSIIQQNIYSGHLVTTPELFGVSTPGKLGNTTQLKDGYAVFVNTYVNGEQQQLESVFNLLLKYWGGSSKIYLQKTSPIGLDIKGDTLAQIAPRSWMLEQLAIDPKKYPDGPAIVQNTNTAAPQSAPMRQQFKEVDALSVFAEFGEPKSGYTFLKTRGVHFKSDEDMLRDELDAAPVHQAFAKKELSDLESSILHILSKDKRVTPETIAKTLDSTVEKVNKALARLQKAGSIASSVDNNGVTSRELTKPLKDLTQNTPTSVATFYLRYSYEWRDEIPTDQRDTKAHPSRDFCKKLMELDRLYSRADIEAISARLGYSVFDRGGGWYTIPDSHPAERRPYCRHLWQSHVLIKNDE